MWRFRTGGHYLQSIYREKSSEDDTENSSRAPHEKCVDALAIDSWHMSRGVRSFGCRMKQTLAPKLLCCQFPTEVIAKEMEKSTWLGINYNKTTESELDSTTLEITPYLSRASSFCLINLPPRLPSSHLSSCHSLRGLPPWPCTFLQAIYKFL